MFLSTGGCTFVYVIRGGKRDRIRNKAANRVPWIRMQIRIWILIRLLHRYKHCESEMISSRTRDLVRDP
jgi:hypothetical protein